ncbi:ABC transporter ATP-binding protein [Luteipulveratus sp. YIM 133132]|uniref:ABC transporter ATP-binding protein n=1 Tax=Luteipulveratus flavus TaxID=3031728 RepID=UPI0023B1C914|nr:ABC transporter ATP-binding protein [Luteipulveratus sp. YIM 133132]MDE9366021.1 ABC transporter ATP-binding protein [Luteipulveratus sp. YIM 133132]
MSTATSSEIGGGTELSTTDTLKRGIALSPELRAGLLVTLGLALVSTIGRVMVPFVVQQTIDNGILARGGPDTALVVRLTLLAAAAVTLTGLTSYVVNLRLFRASEGGLATLRVKAFRHIHDLSTLTQSSERRGSLVSRVTSDVDTISQFVQFGGLMLIVSIGQVTVATVLMAIYSPLLALLVWVCFVPLFIVIRRFQGVVGRAYTLVRERVGEMLAAISESVVGAVTIRAYGVEERTGGRIDAAIDRHRRSAIAAQIKAVVAFSSGQLVAGLTTMTVLAVGAVMAARGSLTLGELLAFLFLVNLFTQPVQTATEILNEMQNAIAGWRRVIGIVDTPADVSDPSEEGVDLPRGPITVEFDDVSFAYPGGDTVLSDVSLTIPPRSRVAVVGETGSGKTTLAKLLTRLMDPATGRVLLDGVDLRRVRFRSLRSRVVMVPQEGFLFDATLLQNIRFGRPDATRDDVRLTLTELGLDGWVEGLPHGLDTEVGQRGESLSAGERQLVALARAYLADPDLLVLDEATSAVDPSTEVRIQRALDGLTTGRTSIAIAHRLSTAEAADEVIVVDRGRVVQRGPHSELVRQTGSVYARLHASWARQQT